LPWHCGGYATHLNNGTLYCPGGQLQHKGHVEGVFYLQFIKIVLKCNVVTTNVIHHESRSVATSIDLNITSQQKLSMSVFK